MVPQCCFRLGTNRIPSGALINSPEREESDPTQEQERAMTTSLAVAESAPRVTFRFGLSGLRWGRDGQPAVLMMHGAGGRPAQFTNFIAPLLARGRQVIALEAPAHEYALDEEA